MKALNAFLLPYLTSAVGSLTALSLAFTLSVATAYAAKPKTEAATPIKSQKPLDMAQLRKKILQALGGYENFKKFNDQPCRAIGKIIQSSTISAVNNSFDCNIVVKRDKQWISISFLGQPLITAYDGKDCWTQQGDTVIPADKITSQRIAEDEAHGFLLLEQLNNDQAKIEAGKNRVFDGKSCQAVMIYAPDGKPTTFYIDSETGLPTASSYQGVDLEQGVNLEKVYRYHDYRTIGGTKQPFRIVEYSGAKKVSETVINTVTIDTNVDDSLFEMPKSKPHASLARGPIKIPFEFVGSEILVKTRFNNSQEVRMIVDTGATQSILDKKTADALGVTTSADDSGLTMTTGAGHIKTGAAKIEKLTIGDLALQNVPFALTDLTSFGQLQPQKPAGLIGANILKRFLVTIDYENETIILEDPESAPANNIKNATIVDTKPSLGMSGLSVEGKINGKEPATFLIDTGAAFNNISESKVKPLMWGPLYKSGTLKGLDGKPVPTGSIRFDSIEIGSTKMSNPIFSVAGTTNDTKDLNGIINSKDLGIIGNPLLSRYTVTLDYRNQKLYLRQSPRQIERANLQKELDDAQSQWIESGDGERALATYRKIAARAHEARLFAQEASARAQIALALCQVNGGKFAQQQLFAPGVLQVDETADKSLQKLFAPSEEEMMAAYGIASNEKDETLQGIILAKWAYLYISQSTNLHYILDAKQKIGKAVGLAPNSAEVLAVSGYFLNRLESMSLPKQIETSKAISKPRASKPIDESSLALVDQIVDQAIMIDPANWLALTTKLERTQRQGKADQAKVIQAQLRHYFCVPANGGKAL